MSECGCKYKIQHTPVVNKTFPVLQPKVTGSNHSKIMLTSDNQEVNWCAIDYRMTPNARPVTIGQGLAVMTSKGLF